MYLNPAGHWNEARPIRLNGTRDSMFGLTVSGVGDLDQDGYGGKPGAPSAFRLGSGLIESSLPTVV